MNQMKTEYATCELFLDSVFSLDRGRAVPTPHKNRLSGSEFITAGDQFLLRQLWSRYPSCFDSAFPANWRAALSLRRHAAIDSHSHRHLEGPSRFQGTTPTTLHAKTSHVRSKTASIELSIISMPYRMNNKVSTSQLVSV